MPKDKFEIAKPNDRVLEYLNSRGVHDHMFHSRRICGLNSTLLIPGSLCAILPVLPFLPRIDFLLLIVIVSMIPMAIREAIRGLRPCKCGQAEALGARGRLALITETQREAIVFSCGAVLCILLTLAHSFVSLPIAACGGLLIGIGTFTLLRSHRSLTMSPQSADNAQIDKHDLSTEQLNQLVDSHLKAGNLEKADEYSRFLLARLEGDLPPVC